jgi:diacylglycerol O-acyltransferase / wax synthase
MSFVIFSLLAAGTIWYLFSNKKEKDPESRKRSMSFSSQIMAQGSFPAEATVSPPIINCILTFHKLPSAEKTKESVSKFLEINRFRSVPDYSLTAKQWEFREVEVNIDDHVVSWTVNSEEEALARVEVIQRQTIHALDNKPQWVFHRIENSGTGVSLVLARFHHAIGDGISLVLVMNKLFTDKNGNPMEIKLPGTKHADVDSKDKKKSGPSIVTQLQKLVQSVLKSAAMGVSAYDSDIVFVKPNRKKCSMDWSASKTVFFPTLRLDFVKTLKDKAGVTVNDIMLAATTGAIRRYCEKLGDPLMKSDASKKLLQYRALLPYAFPRPPEEQGDPFRCMRNKWAFISVPLPINATTPKERLEQCNALMNDAKSSPEALVQLWLQDQLLSRLPTFLVRQTAFDIFSRQSLVFSNVPGPQEIACFGGEPIIGMQSTFPNILYQVLIISYCGSIFMNMVVDGSVVKDSDLLAKSFQDEVADMAKLHGVDTANMLAPMSSGGQMALAANL